MPSLFGLSIAAATRKLEKEGFTVERRQVYSRAGVGTFLGFSPSSNATAPQYSTIFANYSAGRDPAEVAAERRAREEAAERRAEERKEAAEKRKEASDKAREAREKARKKAEAEDR